MTHDGIKNIMRVMVSAYPGFRPVDMQATISVWERMLASYEDKDVAIALEKYIKSDTKGFAPSIGQIIDMMHSKPEISELEAWGMVNRAIRNGNYGAEEEFAKLPDVVQIAVGSPGQIREWARMENDSLQTVAQSNFLRSYRTAVERTNKAEKLCGSVKGIIYKAINPDALPEPENALKIEGVPMPDELKRKFFGEPKE